MELDLPPAWEAEPETSLLTPEVKTQLLRIIQEALTNVRKHARVSQIQVHTALERDHVRVMVSDRGRGFDRQSGQAAAEGHFGLSIMRERAESVGGSLEIISSPGQGTQVVARLPLALAPAVFTSDGAEGKRALRVLNNSPYALTLLGTMLALTLLLRGEPVHFLDLALLAGAYCVQFLVMAGVSDYFFGFWGSLVGGALLTGLLTYLLFRKRRSRLLRVLIYALVGFFTVAYPLSGLLTQTTERNSFDSLVQVGLIVYLFGLSLYTRVEA